ncbi:MAG: DUF4352 domain-containing protein [Thermoleophilia bacterium]|nr:DUF4352 domain-containing protein [Thermoleophilia bacterium]
MRALAIVALTMVVFLAACGSTATEGETSTSAPPATSSGPGPTTAPSEPVSGATSSSANTGLEDYKKAVKEWREKYVPKIEDAMAFLDSLDNPLAATDEQVEAAEDLATLTKESASAFGGIKPPVEAASAHNDYLTALEAFAAGFEQFSEGLKKKSFEDVAEALATLASASENGEDARARLESVLGMSPGPGTAATIASLGSRKNPIPFGATAQVGDWVVKVVDFKPDATQLILKENQFNEPPKAGQQYVLVRLEATYAGKESGTFWVDMSCRFLGNKGNTFKTATVVAPDEISDAGEAFEGASVSGNLVFSVDSDQVAGGLLLLEPSFSFDEERVFFVLE